MSRNYKSIINSIEMDKIPITALRQKTKLILSKLLNSTKIISSDEGLPRDWRGIAYLAGLQNQYEPTIAMQLDPMSKVLQLWNDTSVVIESGCFGNLINFLSVIDRWDVIEDIKKNLDEDAKFYLISYQEIINVPDESVNKIDSDLNILTKDDALRSKVGLPPQQYDAFVIVADEDIDFAVELIERMENFGLKLCIKERDLIGGVTFQHEAIMRLIDERCNRLIVIVSPAFLQSPANTFFVNFAQALGIEQRRRKIIPCLYQHCILPTTLSFYFLLNYQRSSGLWNFWERLRDSIQNTSIDITELRIRAITAPSSVSNNVIAHDPGITSPTVQTNSIQNSSSMIVFNSTNSVELNSNNEKSSTKKWYTKLLLTKKTHEETKTVVQELSKTKKQWFKKKLINS